MNSFRKSGGSDDQDFPRTLRAFESYGSEDPSIFEDLGEGDPDQEDYRSAFYDEDTGEIYEGGYCSSLKFLPL